MNTMIKRLAVILPILVGCPMLAMANDSASVGDTTATRQNPTGWERHNGVPSEETSDTVDTTRARMREDRNVSFRQMIDSSAETYRAIVKGQQEVPQNVLRNARCIAVLPGVVTGALVVGGTHGEGLASCRTADGKWSQPAPVAINSGSIGIQAGAKKTDLVLFLQTPEAEQALKNGTFEFGSDVSAAAGKYETAFDTQGAGVVVYSRTDGVFAGASINGSSIGKDDDALVRDYGKQVRYVALLNGKENPGNSMETDKFTSILP